MPFGAHRDKPMERVPAQYLLWLRDSIIDNGYREGSQQHAVLKYVEENALALVQEASDYDPKHKFSR